MSENDKQDQTDQHVTNNSAQHDAPQSSRRRLLKKSIAIPVIMTLHSGAAMARSSNLAGPAENIEEAVKIANDLNEEQLVCVNPGDGPLDGGPTYDLGEVPTADLVPLADIEGNPLDLEAQAALCQNEGGILISSMAYSSLQGKGFLGNLPKLPL